MNEFPPSLNWRGVLRFKLPVRSGLLPHSAAWFLFFLGLMIVVAPFLEMWKYGRVLEGVLVTAVLFAAVLAVGGRKRSLRLAIVLASPPLIARWLHHLMPDLVPEAFFMASFVVFMAFVVGQFLRFILRAPRVNSEVLCAAVSTYLLLALLWASLYALVARLVPDSFTGLPTGEPFLRGFKALYFSCITLTTVGYGDISPASGPARMLAMAEAITGTMYMAVLVARLVSVYTVEAAESAPSGNRPGGPESTP